MGIVIVEKQKNLNALARSLLLANASGAAVNRAVEAIREANPGLVLDRLEPGTVLVVPDLPRARASTGDPVTAAMGLVIDSLRHQLNSLLSSQSLALAQTRAELETTSEALSAPELRSAVRDPDFKAVVAELRRTAGDDTKTLQAQDERLEKAVKAWSDEIDVLGSLAGGNVT